ncbi:MAG TPA: cytochrome P450 [Acidimicrobiales bacterium]|jgi:cytochrome P450 family 142 subfamily A polypeptide 1|nr:cytochrome P450 [Acidimicrobiales bacterium]
MADIAVTDPPTASSSMPDLLDPGFYVDIDAMHAALRQLRHRHPLARDEKNGLWAVTRHADVVEVERRDDVFVSGQGYRSFFAPGEDNMIAQDDPRHSQQRKLIARRFTPKAVRSFEPQLARIMDELIDAWIDRGEVEVVAELAAPLPAKLTAGLLGFSEHHWTDIKSWSERLMRYDKAANDPEAGTEFFEAIIEFAGLLTEVAAARRAEPADDLISVWTQAEIDGCPLADDTIMNETGLMISGGAETTRTVIARSLAEFCHHPDQWEAMAADPSLVPGAVEEMIRWVTPLNNFFRTAVEPVSVSGVSMAAGDRLILLYPSANRDEAVFDDPYRFDIRRDPNPHVSFGFGTHFCLGAPLARFELRMLMERLTRRITNLRVIELPDIEANIFAGAVRSFRLGFDRRG